MFMVYDSVWACVYFACVKWKQSWPWVMEKEIMLLKAVKILSISMTNANIFPHIFFSHSFMSIS